MKVLFAHNSYKQRGGEDNVVASEIKLLKSNNHNVSIYNISNCQINSMISCATTAFNCAYSPKKRKQFYQELINFKPDVVHVHNFFPILTPAIYDACIEAGIPIVQTLHNYRTICPGAFLYRNGKTCIKCIKGSPYLAIVYRCYRNSIMGSLAVARMVSRHRKLKTWQNKVNIFIALTQFS